MTEDVFLARLRAALVKVSDTPADGVSMDAVLADLDLDSLGRLELMAILEEDTGRRVEDDALESLVTVRNLYEVLTEAALR